MQYAELHNSVIDIDTHFDDPIEQLWEFKKKLRCAEKENEALVQTLHQTEEKLKETLIENRLISNQMLKHKKEMNKQQNEVKKYRNALRERNNEITVLELAIQNARVSGDAKTQIARLKRELEKTGQTHDELKKTIEDKDIKTDELLELINEKEQEVQEAKNERQQAIVAKNALEKKFEKIKSAAMKIERDNHAKCKKFEMVEKQINKLTSQLQCIAAENILFQEHIQDECKEEQKEHAELD